MNERDEKIERALGAMQMALREIANREDCDYDMVREDERPTPCPCPRCTARRALATEDEWRFEGGSAYRRAHSPRELKIVNAWRNYCMTVGGHPSPDFRLAQVLHEVGESHVERYPSARDWYVATTVIQWLATNVGQSLLEEAGYRYGQYKEDQAEREETGRQKALTKYRMNLEFRISNEDEPEATRTVLKYTLQFLTNLMNTEGVRL